VRSNVLEERRDLAEVVAGAMAVQEDEARFGIRQIAGGDDRVSVQDRHLQNLRAVLILKRRWLKDHVIGEPACRERRKTLEEQQRSADCSPGH
jgi:hypothetical protein